MVDISPKLTWKINQYRRKCNFEYNLRQRPFIYILGRLKYKKLKYLMMERQSFFVFDKQWNRRWYGKINIGHSLISMMILAVISIFLKRIVMASAHLYFNAYGDNFYSSWCIHTHWNSGIHTSTLSLLLVPYLWVWIDMYVSCWNKVKIQITK